MPQGGFDMRLDSWQKLTIRALRPRKLSCDRRSHTAVLMPVQSTQNPKPTKGQGPVLYGFRRVHTQEHPTEAQ